MSLLDAILEFFWVPIANLKLLDFVFIVAIGLIVDLCWGFLCRLMVIYERLSGSRKEQSRLREEVGLDAQRLSILRAVEELENRLPEIEKGLRVSRLLIDQLEETRSRKMISDEEYFRARAEHFKEIEQLEEGLRNTNVSLLRNREQLERFELDLDERRKEYMPFVSIIVPCHNSEQVIEDTIVSLMSLNYPNKEIIVVDDASTDKTYEKVSKYADKVTLVRRAKSTGRKTGAINFGLTFARGDIIVVIDDDTIVVQDALRPLVKSFQSPDVGASGGNVRVKARKQNILVKLQGAEYLANMELGRPFQNNIYKAVFVISGCFGAFKRETLEKIGRYDVDIITEDLDVTWKVYRLRKRVLYVHDAVCYTDVPMTVRALIRQRTRWDKGLFETLSKHRNLFFKQRLGSAGFFLLPEALFTEVVMLLLRPAWLITLWLSGYSILQTTLLTVYFYVLLEFLVIFTAGLLSTEKRNALKAFYAPLMFWYRQFLGIVRLRAMILHLSRKKMKW